MAFARLSHRFGGSRAERAGSWRRDIQGLRAVAVLAVLLFHAGVPGVRGGYVGVDMFFVISGFLITTHLLSSARDGDGIDLIGFYARRVRRIGPAALAVTVGTVLIAVVLSPPIGLPRIIDDAVATVLLVPNIVFATRATDYLADHSPSLFEHYWSLGIEEQFYVLWPLVLGGLLVLAARRRISVVWPIGLLFGASLTYCVITTQNDPAVAFFLLPTRAWELLAGALVAWLVLRGASRVAARVCMIGAWLGVALIAMSVVMLTVATPFPGAYALLPVIGTALALCFGSQNPRGGPQLLLAARPLQFIGKISYSLYLVHWPMLLLTQMAVGEQHPLSGSAKLLIVTAAVPVAWLGWRFVETPFRSSRARSERPVAVLLTAGAVAGLILLCLLALNNWASNRDGTLGPPVASAPATPVAPPPLVDVAPSNLDPALEDAAASVPDLYLDGCHQDSGKDEAEACSYGNPDAPFVIAIFGDSHAAQWLPAMQSYAGDAEARVLTYTKSSCPAIDVTVVNDKIPDASCDRWRDNAAEALERSRPDLIVISSNSWYEIAGVPEPDRVATWGRALEATVDRFEAAGTAVLLIADTPRLPIAPPKCISAAPRDIRSCAGSRDEAIDESFEDAERDAAAAAGATFVDLNDFICADTECPVVIDDLLVYRDEHHLTTPFVRYLAPLLAEEIDALRETGRTP